MIRDIIKDFGNIGTYILIILLWLWFRYRMEALELKINARIDKLETSFNARFEVIEAKFGARFEAIEARFDRLQRVFMAYSRGMLNYNKPSFTPAVLRSPDPEI